MKYKKTLKGPKHLLEFENLAKAFLRKEEFSLSLDTEGDIWQYTVSDGSFDKNLLKQEMFRELVEITGYRPKWGITTGIRPIKLTGNLVREHGAKGAKEILKDYYYFSESKANLAVDIYLYQQNICDTVEADSASLYIGIPFCPSRCSYCSFPSYTGEESLASSYVDALIKEMEYVSKTLDEKGLFVETIYVGGGTPTALNEKLLEKLLKAIDEKFSKEVLKEYTVEAGRADTITEEKLLLLEAYGVTRISINPQTVHEETLERIGRRATFAQVVEAYKLARKVGNFQINMDIILGLEGESLVEYRETLEEIVTLKPENITVHPLAIKSSSRQAKTNSDINYKDRELAQQMADETEKILGEAKYKPYYLYRQKNIAGGLENIGYGFERSHCLYNIRIMEERQTIFAMGAGAVSKYYNSNGCSARIPNIIDPRVYIERIDEILQRKSEKEEILNRNR